MVGRPVMPNVKLMLTGAILTAAGFVSHAEGHMTMILIGIVITLVAFWQDVAAIASRAVVARAAAPRVTTGAAAPRAWENEDATTEGYWPFDGS
jgi:uncharacterized protein YqgC (DUF456 family)